VGSHGASALLHQRPLSHFSERLFGEFIVLDFVLLTRRCIKAMLSNAPSLFLVRRRQKVYTSREKHILPVDREKPHAPKTCTEEIEVKGGELLDRVRELLEDVSVRRLIIRKPDGEILIEVPVAAGAAAAGVLTVFAPVLTAIGAMAALVANVKVEIVRSGSDDTNTSGLP